jgi:uncharacterized membrane protein
MSENPVGFLALALPVSAVAVATPALVIAGNPLLIGLAAVIPAAAILGQNMGSRRATVAQHSTQPSSR